MASDVIYMIKNIGVFAGCDTKADGDIIVGTKNIITKDKSKFDHGSEVVKVLYWVGGVILMAAIFFVFYKVTGINLNKFK